MQKKWGGFMKEKRIKNKPKNSNIKYKRNQEILFDDSEFYEEQDDEDIPILEDAEIDEMVKKLK